MTAGIWQGTYCKHRI